MTKKTVQDLASELARALVTDKRQDGAEFVKLKDESPQWMTDVIRKVHDGSFPDDTIYRFIDRAACALGDADDWTDDLEEAIQNIEPDIYTTDLTAWLNERNDHVYYLTEVLEEFGGDLRDGFQLLAAAQQAQIHEIGYALLAALRDLAEDQEEEEIEIDPLIGLDEEWVDLLSFVVGLPLDSLTRNTDYWWQWDRNAYPFGS